MLYVNREQNEILIDRLTILLLKAAAKDSHVITVRWVMHSTRLDLRQAHYLVRDIESLVALGEDELLTIELTG